MNKLYRIRYRFWVQCQPSNSFDNIYMIKSLDCLSCTVNSWPSVHVQPRQTNIDVSIIICTVDTHSLWGWQTRLVNSSKKSTALQDITRDEFVTWSRLRWSARAMTRTPPLPVFIDARGAYSPTALSRAEPSRRTDRAEGRRRAGDGTAEYKLISERARAWRRSGEARIDKHLLERNH